MSKALKEVEDNLPETYDFGDQEGGGLEGADKDSYAIPFLRILQKSSPQVDEAAGEYVEGAKPGMLYNTVTGEVIDGKKGCIVLPCAFQRRFIKWGPRGTSDAGYKGDLLPEQVGEMESAGQVVRVDGRLYFPLQDGSIDDKRCDSLVDTRSHFVLIMNEDGSLQQAMIALSSTGVKRSKALMSILDGVRVRNAAGKLVRPPSWAIKVRLTTVAESNDKGTWHSPKFTSEGVLNPSTDRDILDMGHGFNEAIVSGELSANYANAEDVAEHDERF